MKGIRLRRPSPALVISVVALGGASYAAINLPPGGWTVAVQNGPGPEVDAVAVVLRAS